MQYDMKMVGRIGEWLKDKNPTSQISFDYEEGLFIIMPDGEKYVIEIPYYKAEKIMNTNGANDNNMNDLFEYSVEEAINNDKFEEDE